MSPEVADPPVMMVEAQGAELPPSPLVPRRGSTVLLAGWSVATPVGSLHDFIGETSFRGVELEGRLFVTPQLSLGLGGAWQLYSQTRARETYPLEAGAITTTLYRSTEAFTLRFSAHYYPARLGPVLPFVGLGIGPSSVYFQTLAADLGSSKSGWWLSVQPEAGLFVGVQRQRRMYGVLLTGRYTWTPATFGPVGDMQSVGGSLGFFSLM